MTRSLSVAVAQPLTVRHDVAGNAARHADAIRAASARVIVFPELSLTGYEFDATPIEPTDVRLAPIAVACEQTASFAFAGAPVKLVDGIGIGMLAFDPDGGVNLAYAKIHLGDGEKDRFVPGRGPAVMTVDGWRLGLAICRDTGVPDHASVTAGQGMDLYLAGVLEHDFDREVQPERARRVAVDHGVWVAVASFAGSTGEGFVHAAGRSGIWRPDGTVATQAGSEPGAIATFTLPPSNEETS